MKQFSFTEFSPPQVHPYSIGFQAGDNHQQYYLKSSTNDAASGKQIQAESAFYQAIPPSRNVLPLLGQCHLEGKVFSVFPYIQNDLVDFVGKISDQILMKDILLPLIETLESIHCRGFVHGDIKLENIRVSDLNTGIHIYLSDFGKSIQLGGFNPNRLGALAQHVPTDMTVGPQFDIYSMGVLAFQLLFGFDFIRKFQMTGRDFNQIPESRNVDAKILDFILRATAPSAVSRFKSVRQMRDFFMETAAEPEDEICDYNLDLYFEFYIECMRETFIISNRSTAEFESFVGPWGEEYYRRLKKAPSLSPKCLIHLKRGEDLHGICEAMVKDGNVGMINTLFVSPKDRGTGRGQLLESSAMVFFEQHKVRKCMLNVAETNHRAISFYHRAGWSELPERQYPGALKMEKILR